VLYPSCAQAKDNRLQVLEDMETVFGVMRGFEQSSKSLLTVQISERFITLPITLKRILEELQDQWIGVKLIRGKYYIFCPDCGCLPPCFE